MKQMKAILSGLLALILTLSCLSGAALALEAPSAPALSQGSAAPFRAEEQVRVLVQLAGEPAAQSEDRAAALARLEDQQNGFLRDLDRAGVAWTQRCAYRELLNGLALDLAYGDLETLSQLPEVESVHLVNHYAAPTALQTGLAAEGVKTATAKADSLRGSGAVIAVLDSGITAEHEAFGVYQGSLTKAALKQSAVEAFCQANSRGLWYSEKLPYVWNYAEGNGTLSDNGAGCGTQTASLAAGYVPGSFEGAAPDAQLLVMKIYDEAGQTDSALVFQALEDAWKLGADVIALNLGTPSGFSYDSSLEDALYGNVYQTLASRGVALAAPAGDQGSMAVGASNRAGSGYVTGDYADYGTLAAPASYGPNLAVASAQNGVYPMHAISDGKRNMMLYDGADENFYFAFAGQKDVEFAVVPGYGSLADYAGLQVEGRIALVSRGQGSFQEKVDQAAKAGARGILICNNEPGPLYLDLEREPIPAAAISKADGDYLRSIAKLEDTGSAPAPGHSDTAEDLGSIYYRVTAQSQVVNGVYLLVNEQSSRALNASAAAINKSGNSIQVQIDDGIIQAASAVNKASFHYAAGMFQTGEGGKYLTSPKSDGIQLSASPEDLSVTVTANGSVELLRTERALRYDENWGGFRFLGGSNPLLTASRAQIFLYKRGTARPVAPTAVGKLRFPIEMVTVHDEAGNTVSGFSSMGVTPELGLKPSLTALGGNVSAAARGTSAGYSLGSGTALAAAQAAGKLACLLQNLKEKSPGLSPQARLERAEALLESSAQVLTQTDGTVSSPRRQGSGMTDLTAAASARAYFTQPLLSLGESGTGSWSFRVKLQNLTNREIIYDLGLTALRDQAVTIQRTVYNSLQSEDVSRELQLSGAKTVKLPAGGSVELKLSLKLSDSLKASLLKAFPKGAFLDGYLSLKEHEAACDGGKSCPGAIFTDMPKAGNWAHAGIDYAVTKGLFNGTSKTSFSPEGSMTRAMMVTVLHRLAGKPKPQGNNPFLDVKAKQYYTNAVIWAAENGIVKGTSETEFSPDGEITREQITAILYRYAVYAGAWTGDRAKLSAYPDAAKVSKFAKTALAWAVGAGIVTGNKNNGVTVLDPQGKATRAQVATMFMRFAKTCLQGPAVLDSELHAAFTAFFGDWTKAPILEPYDWTHTANAEIQLQDTGKDPADWNSLTSFQVNTEVNRVWALDRERFETKGLEGALPAGTNPLMLQPFDARRVAISPSSPLNAIAACPVLLRNARNLIMTVRNLDSGALCHVARSSYQSKSHWDPDLGAWSPAGSFLYDGTDAAGALLPGGTRLRVEFYADLAYGTDRLGKLDPAAMAEAGGAWRVWSFDLTIDDGAPEISGLRYDPEAKSLALTVQDDQYLAGLGLAVGDQWSLGDSTVKYAWIASYTDSQAGQSHSVEMSDIAPGTYTLFALDYAANLSTQTLVLGTGAELHPLRFACPEGFRVVDPPELLVSAGAKVLMPELEGETEAGSFMGWVPMSIPDPLDDQGLAALGLETMLAKPGELGTCGGDCVFYPIFRRVTGYAEPLEGLLLYPNGAEDYRGTWAFGCGDFILDCELNAVELEVEDREDGRYFTTPENELLFQIDGDEDQGYTIRNLATEAFLAVDEDGSLYAASGLNMDCFWSISYDRDADSLVLLSRTDDESLLLYDKGRKCFTLVAASRWVPFNQSLSLFGVMPNAWDWFTLGE